jgi:hypothetical protein
LKNLSNARNATNKFTRGIKNSRARFAKEHVQISVDLLRDREQIIPELVNKSNIIQGEVVILLDDADTKHLTFLVIPKSLILLVCEGSKAGEPFLISGHVS